jgi:hypothetical protein
MDNLSDAREVDKLTASIENLDKLQQKLDLKKLVQGPKAPKG